MGTRARVTVVGDTRAELTTLVGRRAEIACVRRLLSTARLVTLTGIGGVGKTRLALRVAGEAGRAVAESVHVVELADLREAELLAQSVGVALGLANPGRDGADATDMLAAYLRDRQALLVLDNCETCSMPVRGSPRRCCARHRGCGFWRPAARCSASQESSSSRWNRCPS